MSLRETLAAIALLFLFGALDPLFDLSQGVPVRRIFVALLWVWAASALTAPHPGKVGWLRSSGPVVLPVVVLALASVAWSVAPSTTAAWGLRLAATTAFGLCLGQLREEELLRVIVRAGLVAAVSSGIAIFAFPEFGTMQGSVSGWKGTFAHKNLLARTMALTTLGLWALMLEARRLSLPRLLASALTTALVLGAESATGGLLLVLGGGLMVALSLSCRASRVDRRRVLVALALIGVLAAGALYRWTEAAFMLVGRTPTLTGRTELWAALVPAILARPWLGHGFAAFWVGSAPSIDAVRRIAWHPAHAHNGFLELCLDLGLAGLAALLLPLVWVMREAFARALRGRGGRDLWPATYLAFLVFGNLSESCLLRAYGPDWALLVAVATQLRRSQGHPLRP